MKKEVWPLGDVDNKGGMFGEQSFFLTKWRIIRQNPFLSFVCKVSKSNSRELKKDCFAYFFMLFTLFLSCLYLFNIDNFPDLKASFFSLSLFLQNFRISLLNQGLSSGRTKTFLEGMEADTRFRKVVVKQEQASSILPEERKSQLEESILALNNSKSAFLYKFVQKLALHHREKTKIYKLHYDHSFLADLAGHLHLKSSCRLV